VTEREFRRSMKNKLPMGTDSVMAEDLIDEYLRLRKLRNQLDKDIGIRGISFQTVSSTGVPVQRQNPSLKDRLNISRQMTTILAQLGLTGTEENTGALSGKEHDTGDPFADL
jgi:hypothetical protein